MSITKHKKSVIADTPERIEQRSGYFFVLVFVLMAIGIAAIGYLSYRKYQQNYRDQVERNLSAIAEQKVDQLVDWRTERLGDASIFFKNPVFTSLVQDFIENPKNADTRWRIQTWVGKIQGKSEYDQVCVLDTHGVTLLSVPANRPPVSSAILQRLPEVLRSGRVTFQDFYRNDYDQHIYLSVLVPILDEKNHNQPLAVFALRINPDTCLYPEIQQWPTDSRTAETLLVRREGNDVLYLNELKFQKDTALKLRISLEKKEIPAVKAVLGQEGIMEGKDYRGAPVVACLRVVPDSPWFLVSRMDTSEVYMPTRERLGVIVIFVIILLFGAAIGLSLLRRQQSLRFYRKQSELAEALLFSNVILRTQQESSVDGILVVDEKGKMLSFNQLFVDMWGIPIDVIESKSDERALQSVMDKLANPEEFAGKVKHLYEVRDEISRDEIVLKDGRIFDRYSAPMLGVEGKYYGRVWYFRDITERKQAELELKNTHDNLLNILDNMDGLVYVADMKTLELLYMNKFGQDTWGEDYAGKKCWQVIQKEQTGPCEFCTNDKLLKADGSPSGVYEWKFQNTKNNRWYDCRDSAIKWFDGRTVRMEIAIDITERKQAEEERNSLQEQLIRSEKLAAVGELIAGVVHEINNPLTGIKGLSELLMNETQDEEKKKDLTFIHQSSERIEKIVKNLQRFSRREKPSRKYVNINELIDVVISIRDYEMKARNIKIERHYQPDLPLVFTDPSQLEQVFLNLITNAEYAIHDEQEKPGTLTVATSVVPDNTIGTVVIEFFDTGAGIPIDVLPKIFNPFFTTKVVGKGTGLGLSVSYGIIKGHGGDISARNRTEGGAVFTIKLPVSGGG